jgi:glycosyltransferase 2 family protein
VDEHVRRMRRYGYAAGALLGILLTVSAILFIIMRTEETPRVVSVWPLLAALGASVATWWLQGLIVAVLARPWLERLRVLDTFRVYMAGTFVAGISPIRGAEIPCEVYLLKRLGLSTGEGSTVVGTRVMLDVAVLTPAALCGLALTAGLPEVRNIELPLVGLAIAGTAAVVFLARGRSRVSGLRRDEPDRLTRAREKVYGFFGDVRRGIDSYWRRGDRTTVAYAAALTIVYWAFRLSCGPLALMAVGWSGDWIPVILAQLLLASLILPLAPTPGGSGARELGLAALLSAHVPEGQLLSGIVVYTGLTYYLPVVVGASFAGRQLWREVFRRGEGRKAALRRGHPATSTPAPAHRRTRAVL